MIITIEEQQMLIDTYFEDKQYTATKALVFFHGMNAMMELVDKKLKAEREARQPEPEQPQTED